LTFGGAPKASSNRKGKEVRIFLLTALVSCDSLETALKKTAEVPAEALIEASHEVEKGKQAFFSQLDEEFGPALGDIDSIVLILEYLMTLESSLNEDFLKSLLRSKSEEQIDALIEKAPEALRPKLVELKEKIVLESKSLIER
jgi:Skp family chaperone for outer membrane proteins